MKSKFKAFINHGKQIRHETWLQEGRELLLAFQLLESGLHVRTICITKLYQILSDWIYEQTCNSMRKNGYHIVYHWPTGKSLYNSGNRQMKCRVVKNDLFCVFFLSKLSKNRTNYRNISERKTIPVVYIFQN